jgi:small-conductance mechanosensitive channel
MVSINDIILFYNENIQTFINVIIIIIIAFVFYKIIKHVIKRALLKRARTKTEKSDSLVLLKLWKYFFIVVLILGLIFYMGGDFTGFGLWAGLFSAALGWALQKPISGIAGWIMVVVNKPFQIGDRILIGSMKGDVIDITLTHIHMKEVGGTINSEEISGRVLMIPNSVLFERNIINYTLQDEYILDDVGILITYESDIDKAVKICEEAADKIVKPYVKNAPKEPYVRTFFHGSGVDIKTRYYVRASERIKMSSDITQEILRHVKRTKNVEIAYPHTEVMLRKKPPVRI